MSFSGPRGGPPPRGFKRSLTPICHGQGARQSMGPQKCAGQWAPSPAAAGATLAQDAAQATWEADEKAAGAPNHSRAPCMGLLFVYIKLPPFDVF